MPDPVQYDPNYPSTPIPADPRGGTHPSPDFDVVSSWENGQVRHVSGNGSSTSGPPPFPNCQGDD